VTPNKLYAYYMCFNLVTNFGSRTQPPSRKLCISYEVDMPIYIDEYLTNVHKANVHKQTTNPTRGTIKLFGIAEWQNKLVSGVLAIIVHMNRTALPNPAAGG
jgi:hypothetical protein